MPSRARSNSASATKSRSLTASSELSNTSAKPRASAVAAGSIGSDVPASAPAPSGDTSRRSTVADEAVDVAGRAPSRGPAGGGRAAPAGPAGRGCSRAGRCRRRPRRGRAARPRRSTTRRATSISSRLHHSRRSVATWSLRLRAVCSLAPAGPASSVTRRSTAVWMSSSLWTKANVSVGQLVLDAGRARRGSASTSSSSSSPARARPPTWAREPAMSSRHRRRSNGRLTV